MNHPEVEKQIQEIVARHLSSKQYKIFLFGSRARGTNRQWSDFDIGIDSQQRIDSRLLFRIKDELEESDIPYLIDVIDLSQISDNFRKHALKNAKLICKTSKQ